jgi:hypothetical protein
MRPMQITASTISLNVDDPAASAEFAKRHFGFEEEMAADGFVSLAHPNAGFNLSSSVSAFRRSSRPPLPDTVPTVFSSFSSSMTSTSNTPGCSARKSRLRRQSRRRSGASAFSRS